MSRCLSTLDRTIVKVVVCHHPFRRAFGTHWTLHHARSCRGRHVASARERSGHLSHRPPARQLHRRHGTSLPHARLRRHRRRGRYGNVDPHQRGVELLQRHPRRPDLGCDRTPRLGSTRASIRVRGHPALREGRAAMAAVPARRFSVRTLRIPAIFPTSSATSFLNPVQARSAWESIPTHSPRAFTTGTRRIWCFSIRASTSAIGFSSSTVIAGSDMHDWAVCSSGFTPLAIRRHTMSQIRDHADRHTRVFVANNGDLATILQHHQLRDAGNRGVHRAARWVQRHDTAGQQRLLRFGMCVHGLWGSKGHSCSKAAHGHAEPRTARATRLRLRRSRMVSYCQLPYIGFGMRKNRTPNSENAVGPCERTFWLNAGKSRMLSPTNATTVIGEEPAGVLPAATASNRKFCPRWCRPRDTASRHRQVHTWRRRPPYPRRPTADDW